MAGLFPGQHYLKPISTRQLYRVVVEAAQAADIAKRVGPHTLRHSFATYLLEDDIDIRIIQALLGHTKLENTAFYTRVATRTVRAVTSPLDKLGLFLPELEARHHHLCGGPTSVPPGRTERGRAIDRGPDRDPP